MGVVVFTSGAGKLSLFHSRSDAYGCSDYALVSVTLNPLLSALFEIANKVLMLLEVRWM